MSNSGNSETSTNDKKIRGFRMYKTALFNFDEETQNKLIKFVIEKEGGEYVIGKETCPQTHVAHLQTFVKFKNQVKWEEIEKAIGIHSCWKQCGGKSARKDNFTYCTKEGDYVTNMSDLIPSKSLQDIVIEKEYKEVKWKFWQQCVLALLETEPHNRHIYWMYEETGNTGKSYLAKYLACTYELILGEGKRLDVYNQVLSFIKEKEKSPKIIILDIPRDSMEYVNYASIEQLKNGCLYSGKYEGGQCVFEIPHVLIFSNQLPSISSMSRDRWKIFNIIEENLKEININTLPLSAGSSRNQPLLEVK